MIKKIQQYLLTHYPLLWNIKLVPFLLLALAINLFFACISYFLTIVNFEDTYHSDSFSGEGLVYFGAVILGVLLFILWLVQYSKNNAFKVFYPKSSRGLFLEWVLSFVIIFSLVLFPFSCYFGSVLKLRSYANFDDAAKAAETLNMAQILIPTDVSAYFEEGYTAQPDVAYEEYNEGVASSDAIKEPPAVASAYTPNNIYFSQVSLLNYNGYTRIYVPDRYGLALKGIEDVKKMLINEDKAKISKLMDDFLELHQKHNLKTNLTKDKWMKMIYNPSKYLVGSFNQIIDYNYADAKYSSEYSSEYFVSYQELVAAYESIVRAHYDPGFPLVYLLVAICLALGLSLCVFSFRVTTGKWWLAAFISIGLILFIDLIFSILTPRNNSFEWGLVSYVVLLLVLFAVEFGYLVDKIVYRKAKGRSNIIINHIIWFIPAVPVMIFALVYLYYQGGCYANYTEYDSNYNGADCLTRRYMEENIVGFIWANVCLTFVSMYFFITLMLRKWKSTTEE